MAELYAIDTKNDIEVVEKMIGSISVDRLTLLLSMPDSETSTGFQKT
jgi:hypothetical protein